MPYCTIEEAWGNNLTSNKSNDRFKKITPEFSYDPNDSKYFPSEYSESDIFDKNAQSIFCKKKKNKVNRKKSFSRTYNRLPEHSGPKTRLPKTGKIQKRLVFSKKKKKKLADINSIPNNDNLDVPINNYDKLLEQKLNNNYDSDSDIEISDEQENFENKENYVTLLRDENIKLKNMIEEIKNTSYDRNDNIFDLIIFLSTGIFVIFLLDTVTKSIRKF